MKWTAAWLVMTAAVPLLGAAEWSKAATNNFELYTTSNEREARQTLQLFEQVRAFFMNVKSSSVTTRLPVTIVGFRNPKEYKPYAVNEVAAAYYIGDEQRDYIVMSDLGLESQPVAIHEYMHLLVRHSGLKMPIWLNEGFADLYSTLKPQGGQILLGSIPQGRAYSLSQEKWLPLPVLFGVRENSPEYNEKTRAGIFYAQSWILTHMLALGNGYRNRFSQFVAQLSASGSSDDAFLQVYGKTAAQVQTDLNSYFHANSMNGVLFKTQFEKFTVGPMQPATELEIGLTLAKLVALTGHPDAAASRLDRLVADHKDSYEVEEALAYLEWRKGNADAARRHFGLAVDRGAASWKTCWDYARLLGERDTERSVPLLRKAIELKPELTEARLLLGNELYRSGKYAQALIALREVKKVDEERASPMFLMMAYSAMQLKMEDEARRYAQDAAKYARQPAETDGAQRLIAYLDRKNAAAAPPLAQTEESVELPATDEPRPELRRRQPDTPAPEPAAPVNPGLTAKGRLTQLDCIDGMARMHVNSDGSNYVLLIRKPENVTIRNQNGKAVDMTCGPQNAPVTVEYAPAPDARFGTTGDVRTIEFGQ